MGNKKTITVLYAHGSSSEQWQSDIVQLASSATELSDSIRIAYMELCKPTLEDIILEEGEGNIEKINVLPLFLATGKHLKIDIPRQVAELSERFAISIDLLSPIGEHPLLIDAIKEITANLLSEQPDEQ